MPPIQPKIKLAIADDHKLFRKGIISLIELHYNDRYHILIEAENGDDLINQLTQDKKLLPDIVIMDIEMPKTDGYQTAAWLREYYPSVKVLVVSQVDKEESLIRMLRMDVKGYLSKDIEPKELHEALQTIHNKGFYYTDHLSGKLLHIINGKDVYLDIWATLSEKEREFITHACTELTYKQIADEMFLSPKTIDGYRHNLFERFTIKTRVGLVIFAIRNGLVKI